MAEAIALGSAEKKIVVEFKKSYKFEGKEYTELDLSGLEKLTVQDVIDAQRELTNQGDTIALGAIESTTGFAMVLATKASRKPVEMFKLMPRKTMEQVQETVMKVLGRGQTKEQTEMQAKTHVVKFNSLYIYNGKKADIKGQTFESVDLSGVGDLCTMHELTAENRMAAEGFMVLNKDRNYLHAVIVASQATGLPEDFFTGLPLCEATKLRNAVDSGFFE
ncbi:MAG: phage tail assembly protein [Faecalibacterium sp.]